MNRAHVCIEREEENRWVGRIFEEKSENGVIQYRYAIIAPLYFEKGHSIDRASHPSDAATPKLYSDLEEARTAMRYALHQRADAEAS